MRKPVTDFALTEANLTIRALRQELLVAKADQLRGRQRTDRVVDALSLVAGGLEEIAAENPEDQHVAALVVACRRAITAARQDMDSRTAGETCLAE